MLPIIPQIIFPTLMYAEIHYRFKYFFSFLKKREPEIIFDAPYRVEPNKNIPIMLFIKDADLYPISIGKIEIEIRQKNKYLKKINFEIFEKINSKFWFKIFYFNTDNTTPFGCLEIFATLKFGNKIVKIDNYRTSKKTPLFVFRSKSKLLTNKNFVIGDLHYHSNYTNDQVEFGAPLEATQILANSIGLNFFSITDHSYDLDDRIDNFLINDLTLPKWNNLLNEIKYLNLKNKFSQIILGEEVSCRNSKNRNVHLLILGSEKFYFGSGDSAEKWFKTKSQNTIEEILNDINSDSMAIAAHPKENVPYLHKFFFNRSTWSNFDLTNHYLHGMQILNGEINDAFYEGKKTWIELLLSGQRIKIFAGNDAHGNFNRFRQLSIPFFKVIDKNFQIFGNMKTAIKSNSNNPNKILNQLKNNYSVITTGPIIDFKIIKKSKIIFNASSNSEFGIISQIIFYIGDCDQKKENSLKSFKPIKKYRFNSSFKINNLSKNSYIRAELFTKNGDGVRKDNLCFSNPIWLDEN